MSTKLEKIISERTELNLQLRRNRRLELLNERRNREALTVNEIPILPTTEIITQQCQQVVQSNNFQIIPTLRTYLSHEKLECSIIIQSGVIPKIIEAMHSMDHDGRIQMLLFINDFCAISQQCVEHVLSTSLINALIQLIQSNDLPLIIVTLTILANISGYDEQKEIINQFCVIQNCNGLLQQFNYDVTLKQTLSWLFLNMCRGRIVMNNEVLMMYVQFFFNQLNDINDKQCISDALWAFYYLSCKKEYCSLLNNDDLQSKMLYYMKSKDISLCIPTMRFINNAIVVDEVIAVKFISCGLFDIIIELTKQNDVDINKELIVILSNLAACENNLILQQLLETGCIIGCLSMYNISESDKIVKDIEWTISNFVYGCSDELLTSLLQQKSADVIALLCQILLKYKLEKEFDTLVSITLKGVIRIFEVTNEDQFITDTFELHHLDEYCDELIESRNKNIKKRAQYILDNYYYDDEDDDEDDF